MLQMKELIVIDPQKPYQNKIEQIKEILLKKKYEKVRWLVQSSKEGKW